MTALLALTAGLVAAAGLYLMLSRDLLRIVIGTSVLGTATVLVLLCTGGFAYLAPPIVPDDAVTLELAANPVPQALVLTAIVIAFALTCFSFVLMLRLVLATGSDDAAGLDHSEPPSTDPLYPSPADDDVLRLNGSASTSQPASAEGLS